MKYVGVDRLCALCFDAFMSASAHFTFIVCAGVYFISYGG